MSRETYVWRDGDLVPKSEAEALAAPKLHIIGDAMPAIKSMADGKMYDSKSRYYASIRAQGYEVVGNEKLTPRRREPDERAISNLVDRVMRGETRSDR